jgi:SAM-dependent methyltransferase
MKTRLCELAEKWHTDKVRSIYHDYTPFYSELLEGHEIRRILEIGIGTPITMMWPGYIAGASLRMWEEYFPAAEVFGLDIDGSALINQGRIRSLQCDQGNETALIAAAQQLDGNFDLIIDDGSHVPAHQELGARVLTRFLRPRGIYVIEDVADPGLRDRLGVPCEMREFQPALPSKDNRVIVIRKENL